MNQSEWSSCTDPKVMLQSLGMQLNDRQLKQFCVACYHQIESYLTDEARRVVVAIEAEVNGCPDSIAFKAACGALETDIFDPESSSTLGGILNDYVLALTDPPALQSAKSAISAVLRVTEWNTGSVEYIQARAQTLSELATLLREIVGNPF
jgi:hypothetical protein